MFLTQHKPHNGERGQSHKYRGKVCATAKSRKQGFLIGVLLGSDKEGSDHGADNSHGGNKQRYDNRPGHHLGSDASKGGSCKSTAGNDRSEIGLVKVGAHACHVPDIVSHIVRNNCGVSGVVFGDTRLDLTHKVGAHISGLGENSAAHTGKQRHK